MDITERALAFVQLGNKLKTISNAEKETLFDNMKITNPWFTEFNSNLALLGIIKLLEKKEMLHWVSTYSFKPNPTKKVGVIAAGNIPAVCFHDLLCTLISGHSLHIKLSKDDKVFPSYLIKNLLKIQPLFSEQIFYTDTFKHIDALIVTGSNNTAKHFEYYFSHIPKIVRKNRTSIAVLNGNEDENELKLLGNDIFSYFGMGCRNVSKLFVPDTYDITKILPPFMEHAGVINNQKYGNNYEYNRTIYLMNGEQFLDNNFLLLKESTELVSPIAVLYYERYSNKSHLNQLLEQSKDKIQCIVKQHPESEEVKFGDTQTPAIHDYADGVDTMKFLSEL